MALGSVQYVIECVPSGTGSSTTPCINDGATGYMPSMVQAYVLDPSSQAALESSLGPFDYTYAAGLWTLSFSMVVGLFVISRYAGVVLNLIRRG